MRRSPASSKRRRPTRSSRCTCERPGRLEGRFAQLERERLARLASEWLEIERERPPFEVAMREESLELSAGNLQIHGRIDRVDRLEGGGLAVIDYKTGRVSVAGWMGERPDDAQLPLYALAAGEGDVRAVAFARLRSGDLGFSGLAREAGTLPGVQSIEKYRGAGAVASWQDLLDQWRREVNSSARTSPAAMRASIRRRCCPRAGGAT